MAPSPAPRAEVFGAIESERAYQNERWGRTASELGPAEGHQAGHNPHSVTEWLVYMKHYAEEGLKVATTNNDPEASRLALEFARKVAALGVVCMEQHGAPRREGY